MRPPSSTATTVWTWVDLDRRADAIAAAVRALGLGTGDRVGLAVGGSALGVAALHGVPRTGVSAVLVHPRLTSSEVATLVGAGRLWRARGRLRDRYRRATGYRDAAPGRYRCRRHGADHDRGDARAHRPDVRHDRASRSSPGCRSIGSRRVPRRGTRSCPRPRVGCSRSGSRTWRASGSWRAPRRPGCRSSSRPPWSPPGCWPRSRTLTPAASS